MLQGHSRVTDAAYLSQRPVVGLLGSICISTWLDLLALREQGEAGLDLVAEIEDVIDETAAQHQLHVINLCARDLLHQRLYLDQALSTVSSVVNGHPADVSRMNAIPTHISLAGLQASH